MAVIVIEYVAVGASMVVALLSGLMFLHNLSRKMKKTNDLNDVVGHGSKTDADADDDKVMNKSRSRAGGDADGDTDTCTTNDVIIVGAGVAGAALAYALAKDGRRVHIIERDLGVPDRMAGEFLLPAGRLKLLDLGLLDCLSDIDAQPVSGYALYKDGKELMLPYPIIHNDHRLDVSARCFHNGRFVQRLRHKATTLPNVRMEEGTVTSLISEKGTIEGVHYKTKNGESRTSFAPLTVVCDGGSSNLRRSLCKPLQVQTASSFVGVTLKNCQLPYQNLAHFILQDPTLILFYPISSTEIRCVVDIPAGEKLPSIAKGEMADYLNTVVSPQVPPQLRDAFIASIEKGNIRTMANRSMAAHPNPTPPGAFLLGDAFNMRHPITGAGMTVALSDVIILTNLLKGVPDLTDTPALSKALESFYTLRKPVASTINMLADALHKGIGYSPDPVMKEMRTAIFNYLALGGMFSRGLMHLLSGLNPNPFGLVLQFLAIALYGAGKLMFPLPTPQKVWLAARLLWGACGIMIPIVRAEGLKHVFAPTKKCSFL